MDLKNRSSDKLQPNTPLGLIHVYTGNGKGKTTAAIGLGIRFVGTGKTAFMVQFYKSWYTSELSSLEKLPTFKVFRFCKQKSFTWCMNAEQEQILETDILEAWAFAKKSLIYQECEMLILDEVILAVNSGIIDINDFINTIIARPSHIEVIITGRDAPRRIIDIANYVSEIKCIRHPFNDGIPGVGIIPARRGIDY